MAHQIKDECVGCGSCTKICTQRAIVSNGDKYKIDAEKCVDCGDCVAICPVEAIKE
ncbi:MAG: 4Fe-4S binding protein [Elusimicrobiota bacterium]